SHLIVILSQQFPKHAPSNSSTSPHLPHSLWKILRNYISASLGPHFVVGGTKNFIFLTRRKHKTMWHINYSQRQRKALKALHRRLHFFQVSPSYLSSYSFRLRDRRLRSHITSPPVVGSATLN
uniref:Maturase K n=1 Tax=Parascaris univalens TaxID=6257 RepID=A0A915BS27_PARUN